MTTHPRQRAVPQGQFCLTFQAVYDEEVPLQSLICIYGATNTATTLTTRVDASTSMGNLAVRSLQMTALLAGPSIIIIRNNHQTNATFYGNAARDSATIYNEQFLEMNNSIITHSADLDVGDPDHACDNRSAITGSGNLIGIESSAPVPFFDTSCNSE